MEGRNETSSLPFCIKKGGAEKALMLSPIRERKIGGLNTLVMSFSTDSNRPPFLAVRIDPDYPGIGLLGVSNLPVTETLATMK
jgi:hypothetical protein